MRRESTQALGKRIALPSSVSKFAFGAPVEGFYREGKVTLRLPGITKPSETRPLASISVVLNLMENFRVILPSSTFLQVGDDMHFILSAGDFIDRFGPDFR